MFIKQTKRVAASTGNLEKPSDMHPDLENSEELDKRMRINHLEN